MGQNILLSIVFMLVSTMAFAQAQAFDLTLQPLNLLSHRLFVPKFNSLMGRAGLFRLQRVSLVSDAEDWFYRPSDTNK
jgi:hypothetical protein